MPTVTCPGCQKQYNLPATAVGQNANCKCGTRFRVGGAPASASTATSTGAPQRSAKPAGAAPKPQVAAAKRAVEVASPVATTAAKDDFWDTALNEPVKTAPPVAAPAPRIGSAAHTAVSDRRRRPEDEVKPKKKVIWGADWAKVGGGLMTFLVAGGITAGLLFTTGRLFFWPAGIAVVGLFTCLSGLIGEEGIW